MSNPESFVRDLEARAERVETPCGDGTMVWHRWGKGPPLVFFHGGSGSWTHWIRNIEDLSRDHTLWIADLPGWGDSAEPMPPDDLDASASAIIAGLDIILPHGPFRTVAFSAGTIFGTDVALRMGARVRQHIVIDAGALGIPLGDFTLRSLKGITDAAGIADVHRFNLANMMFADPARIDDIALYLQNENTRRARFNVGFMMNGTPALDRLQRLRVPLGVIWGGLDKPHPQIEAHRALFKALQPDAPFHVIEGAGHWVMYEAPERFNAALRAALAQVPES